MINIFSLFLLSIILAIIGFIFEAYPRFLNRKFGVDIWTHLLYLKEFHRQKGIPAKISNGFIVEGEYDYPPMFIFILSRFPFKLVEKYEFLFSPFFDAIHLIIIFFISYYLTNNIFFSFSVQILYILTPIIVLENSSATPRSLGYTLFTIVFSLLFLFQSSGILSLFIVSILIGSLIFLSHRFTTQGFLFFSIFFTVIEKDLIFIACFTISFLLSLILSKGFYLKVLKGHIGNLKFWKNNIRYRFSHQVKGDYKTFKTKDFVFRLYNQFLKFPPFVLTITNPWTLALFYSFFFQFSPVQLIQNFLWWGLFAYILAIATTWIPQLRFLGEGQRYLELSAFPTSFIASKVLFTLFDSNFRTVPLIVYGLVSFASFITIIVIQRKAIVKDSLRTLTPDMEEMYEYIAKLAPQPRLLCIPHQITTNTIYHTDCSVLVNVDYKSIEQIEDIYPYIRKPIPDIMKKFNLDMILLNEEYASIKDLHIEKFKIVKRFNNFILLKV